MSQWPYSTAAWKKLRQAQLSLHPLCEGCLAFDVLTPANTVDHRVPIKLGGEAFPDHDGLASLCGPCHSRKTARGPEAGAFKSRKPRPACTPDGAPLDRSHPWYDAKARKRAAKDERTPRPPAYLLAEAKPVRRG